MPALALGLLALLFGLGLAYAAEWLKVETDPRIDGVRNLLPGYECGACGYPGCQAFAEAIVEDTENVQLTMCKPGREIHYTRIMDYLKQNPDKDGNIVKVKK